MTFVDEWGMKRQLTGDVLPAVLESPIPDITRHREYTFPDPAGPHRFTAVERALERFGDRKAMVLNLRDGFSDMRDLLGYEGSLMSLLLEPQAYGELLERSVQYNLAVAAVARQRYGLEIVATTDDIANATRDADQSRSPISNASPRSFARRSKATRRSDTCASSTATATSTR